MAVARTVLLNCPYSEEQKLTLCMEHDTLRGILNPVGATGQSVHPQPRLAQLEFNVEHKARTKNQAVDACLQLNIGGAEQMPLNKTMSYQR